MNNDLISREALKTALANNTLIRDFNLLFDGIIGEIIDNAPTADVNEIATFNSGYLLGKLVEERPQGEWKVFYTPKKKKVFKCDKCMAVSIQGQTNFCPNCGADMRGSK